MNGEKKLPGKDAISMDSRHLKVGEMDNEMEADEHLAARGMKGDQMTTGSGSGSKSDANLKIILMETFCKVGHAVETSPEIVEMGDIRVQDPSGLCRSDCAFIVSCVR